MYCLSLLMLLKVFRRSTVIIRKHTTAWAHNGAVVPLCVFVCFIWTQIQAAIATTTVPTKCFSKGTIKLDCQRWFK